MICLGNEPRSICHFWGCTQLLYFRLLYWLWRLFHFFEGILAYSSRYNGHLNLPIPIHFSSLIPKVSMLPSLLPSPLWLLPVYIDSWNWHTTFLCSIVLYSIRLYFHHQTQLQLASFPLWFSLFIASEAIYLLFLLGIRLIFYKKN